MKYSSKLLLSALALLGGSAPVLARGGAESGEGVRVGAGVVEMLGKVARVVEGVEGTVTPGSAAACMSSAVLAEVVGAVEGMAFEVDQRFQPLAWRDTLQRYALPRGVVVRREMPGRVTARALPTGLLPRGLVSRGDVSRARAAAAEAPLLGAPTRRTGGPSFPSGVLEAESLVGDLLRESNAVRRLHGAGVLVMDAGLTRAAERYARELARRGEVEHVSPTPGLRTFRDRISNAGVRARVGGENLARLSASAARLGERTVQAWLRSPGHRYNLLDPIFARTGIGVWLGNDGIWYVVQVYATER